MPSRLKDEKKFLRAAMSSNKDGEGPRLPTGFPGVAISDPRSPGRALARSSARAALGVEWREAYGTGAEKVGDAAETASTRTTRVV